MDERTEFADAWPWYIRRSMGVGKMSRHVWPYNVDFALRSKLASINNNGNNNATTLDALITEAFDRDNDDNDDNIVDVPGAITIENMTSRVGDPYAFPNDSAVYRTWKTVNAAVPIIDEAISNLEQQTRRLTAKNEQLVEQIDRMTRLTFVQNGFIEKFKLVAERA